MRFFPYGALLSTLGMCTTSASAEPERAAQPFPEVAEVLYSGALRNGWMDYGW